MITIDHNTHATEYNGGNLTQNNTGAHSSHTTTDNYTYSAKSTDVQQSQENNEVYPPHTTTHYHMHSPNSSGVYQSQDHTLDHPTYSATDQSNKSNGWYQTQDDFGVYPPQSSTVSFGQSNANAYNCDGARDRADGTCSTEADNDNITQTTDPTHSPVDYELKNSDTTFAYGYQEDNIEYDDQMNDVT